MSKLQRTVDGQTLAFVTLPRIFQSLATDTPSGSIRLAKGEHAYWRLTRNLGDLKKNGSTIRDCATRLTHAFKALTESEAFMNHYGLVRPPEVSNEANMTKLFISLLQLNVNRVEQSSVFYDRSKPLVESVVVPLAHQVQFTATRGMTRPAHGGGLKGRLWLKEADHAADVNHFTFNISSPIVNLGERLHPDRLQKEIITKLRQNMPSQVHNPVVEFDEGQFNDFLGNGLKALVEKTAHAANGNSKKKGALVKPAIVMGSGVVDLAQQVLEKAVAETSLQQSKVGRGMIEAVEYNPEFKGRGHSMPNVSIDDQQFIPATTTDARLTEEAAKEVKGRGQNTSTFPIDECTIIDVTLDRSTGNTFEKDSDGNLVVTVNDDPAADKATYGNELKNVVGDGNPVREFSEGAVKLPEYPVEGLKTALGNFLAGDEVAAETAAQVAEAIADAELQQIFVAEKEIVSARGIAYKTFFDDYRPEVYPDGAWAAVMYEGGTLKTIKVNGQWHREEATIAVVDLPDSVQAAYDSAVAVQDTGLLEALELVPAADENVAVDPVLNEQQQMKADRDVRPILEKIRAEIGVSTSTRSVVIPTALSNTQKAAVRDALVREGVGAVWFYNVIDFSTAVVLQWVTNEGEPSVDISGQLMEDPRNVEVRPDAAGDTTFSLPA